MSDEIRRQEIRQALADPNRCDHEIFACGLSRGHEGKHRTIISVRDDVRVFRYMKPNGPVYRAYPDGRVTRNGHEIDPSNLSHCESSVRQGAMTETSEPLLDSETERPRRCPAVVPEGNVVTEGRQCQQYEGHAHDHTWYGDNGLAYSAWSTKVQL